MQSVRELVLASHNAGKLEELKALLAPFGVAISSAANHGVPEPEETGDSFVDNASLKALHTANHTGKPALADDSGLVVAALGGAPGIYSARWAGPNKDFSLAMERVREALVEAGCHPIGADAYFTCVLCLAWPNGETHWFEGQVHGNLTFPPRGDKGFGYDPIFVPQDHTLSFGEMEPDEKHRMSHRAVAFDKLERFMRVPA